MPAFNSWWEWAGVMLQLWQRSEAYCAGPQSPSPLCWVSGSA